MMLTFCCENHAAVSEICSSPTPNLDQIPCELTNMTTSKLVESEMETLEKEENWETVHFKLSEWKEMEEMRTRYIILYRANC